MYDSRAENLNQMSQNLNGLIKNAGFLLNDMSQKLTLLDTQYIAQFQILKYTQLFTIYLVNKYLAVSASDLIKISTWLNDAWRKYLLGKF
jgi:hypothetical protein